MELILSGVSIPMIILAINIFSKYIGANKFESIFYTNPERFWKKVVYCIILLIGYIFLEIGLALPLESIAQTDGKWFVDIIGISAIIAIIVLFLLQMVIMRYEEKTEKITPSIEKVIKGRIGYAVVIIPSVLVLAVYGKSMISEGMQEEYLFVNLFLLCWLVWIFKCYTSLVKKISFVQRFFFVREEAGKQVKYYIHYAENKEYVLCSKEADIDKMNVVRFFKMTDIKDCYEIQCERIEEK